MASENFIDRDRGILTQADRRYLLGETELDGDSARQARQRIRDRTKNAIIDFTALRFGLEEKDRTLIGNDLFGGGKSRLWQGYIDMFTFFYILNQDFGHSLHPDLQRGIQEAEDQLHENEEKSIEVELDFEVRKKTVHDYSELIERFEEGSDLTPEEMQTLLFESEYFSQLREEDKWNKFAEFLNGDLDVGCNVETEFTHL